MIYARDNYSVLFFKIMVSNDFVRKVVRMVKYTALAGKNVRDILVNCRCHA